MVTDKENSDKKRSARIFEAAKYLKQQAKSQNSQNSEQNAGLRIAMAGKGGVGKTTLSALLCHLFADQGSRVLAVDEDPQQNMAFALGFAMDKADSIVPVSKNLDYIEEKTGSRPGQGWGAMLRLNPDVSDVVDRFGMHISDNIDLLIIGSVIQAATGCLCPENTLLDSIVRYIRLRQNEVVVMDTQAGVEHFGRAMADGFRRVVVITEPSFNATQVALHSARLARDLNVPDVHLVASKCRSEKDRKKVKAFIKDFSFSTVDFLPFEPLVLDCEPDVSGLLELDIPYVQGVKQIFQNISS